MPTRRGTPFSPRTARRAEARRAAATRSRSRTHSVPIRLPPSRQSADPLPEIQVPRSSSVQDILMESQLGQNTERPFPTPSDLPSASQALPGPSSARPAVSTPATIGVAPGSAAQITTGLVDLERTVRNICISEYQHHKRALNQTIDALREDVRALQARMNQLDTVIADTQTLRRDVNSLLESARLPTLAEEQGLRYPGAGPAQPIVVEEATAPRPADHSAIRRDSHHREKLTPDEPETSSFTRMPELLARLERLEHSKRDEHDNHKRVRHASREHYSRKHRHHRREETDSDSSSDNGRRRRDDSSSDDSSSEEDRHRRSRRTPKRGGTFRPKGERYRSLKPLRATDSKFKEVLDYRYYRLERTSKSRDLGKLRHQVKQMMVTLRRHIFDGRDPILILDFLRRYSNECDAQRMSEPQAHCALEYFLDGTAADHFVAVNNSSTADEGGVSCWPEAVHYLLRSYATHDAIREASLRLTSIRQSSAETEEEYSARLNNAAIRCGNVHPMDDKKTIFIDGLITATKSLVSRYREDNPRSSYLELVQYASVEGKTHRARAGVKSPKKPEMAKASTPKQSYNPLLKRSKPALFAESFNASDDIFMKGRHGDHVDNLQLFGEATPAMRADPFSDDTSDLPTTEPSQAGATEQETDPALYFTPRSRPPTTGGSVVKPQRLNYDEKVSRNRPGWQAAPGHPRPQSPGTAARIICHVCYVKNEHIAPDCTLPLKEQWQVVRNYSSLSADEKARVPSTSYHRACAQFAEDGSLRPDPNAKPLGGTYPDTRRSDERHPAVLQRAKTPNRSGN